MRTTLAWIAAVGLLACGNNVDPAASGDSLAPGESASTGGTGIGDPSAQAPLPPGVDLKLTLEGPAFTPMRRCSSAFTIKAFDGATPYAVAQDAQLVVSSVRQGTVYMDAACTMPAQSITIPKGASQVSYWIKDRQSDFQPTTGSC